MDAGIAEYPSAAGLRLVATTRHGDAHPTSVTELLLRARDGHAEALSDVFPLVYAELRRLATAQLRREGDGHTLSPTGLVHEAYLRLVDQRRAAWKGRAHFLSVASRAMRRILIDRLRRRRALKRGGLQVRLALDSVPVPVREREEALLALDEALLRLAAFDERQARVVECRFFGGMTEEETAEALGIGLRTVKRDWAKARSWLHRELAMASMPDEGQLAAVAAG